MIILKKKILAITAGLLTAMALTACGKDPKLTQFKGEIDAFCTEISDIDTAINNVDAESDTATDELLGYLDQLDTSFQNFAELDFPTEFDYLESLADEASAYMTQTLARLHIGGIKGWKFHEWHLYAAVAIMIGNFILKNIWLLGFHISL